MDSIRPKIDGGSMGWMVEGCFVCQKHFFVDWTGLNFTVSALGSLGLPGVLVCLPGAKNKLGGS